jgi:hypothetical protein
VHFRELTRGGFERGGVDAGATFFTAQRLTAQLDDDATVTKFSSILFFHAAMRSSARERAQWPILALLPGT